MKVFGDTGIKEKPYPIKNNLIDNSTYLFCKTAEKVLLQLKSKIVLRQFL